MVEHIWFLLHHYSLVALFGLLTVEESGVPVPVPGDFVMGWAGYQARLGYIFWYEAFLCGVAATLIGSFILYHVGRRGGRPLLKRYGRYLHLTESRQCRIEGWLGRYGGFAVFAGRLIPGFRCGSSFVAGTFGVRLPIFIIATAGSAAVWWGLFLYLGYQIGPRVARAIDGNPFGSYLFLGLLLLSSIVPAYVRFRMHQERRQQATSNEPILTRLP